MFTLSLLFLPWQRQSDENSFNPFYFYLCVCAWRRAALSFFGSSFSISHSCWAFRCVSPPLRSRLGSFSRFIIGDFRVYVCYEWEVSGFIVFDIHAVYIQHTLELARLHIVHIKREECVHTPNRNDVTSGKERKKRAINNNETKTFTKKYCL